MNGPRWLLRSTLALSGVLLLPLVSPAIVLDTVLDRHLTQHAELIFIGSVTAVDYKVSEPNEEVEAGIPHTFITFSVEEIFKGSLAGDGNLTLRIQGGPDNDDTFMQVSGVPLYDVGDRGVFFVRRNGSALCPLVGWQRGSFRILDGGIYSDLGYEMILNDDPMRAARIHPRDLRNVRAMAAQLVQAETAVEKKIWESISDESRALLLDPAAIDSIDPRNLSFSFPPEFLAEFANEILPQELTRQLLPPLSRTIPRDFVQAMLFRDFNGLLLQRDLFSADDLINNELRPQTRALLEEDPAQMPLAKVLLRNRRVLEDLYPNLIVRSLDRSAVEGSYHQIHEILNNTIGNAVYSMVLSDLEQDEGPLPSPEAPPTGARMTPEDFITHIRLTVNVQTIQGEQIPPVVSVDINEPFTAPALTPVRITIDHDAPKREPETAQERLERTLLEASGGNPVLRQ